MKPEQLSETSNECSSMLVIHGSNNTSLDGKSNESNSHERFSIFSDAACGEVLTSQHLIIDFTPVEEIDNEFVQRKCCSFWEFINSRKDLRHFMMTPGERESSSSTSQEIITEIKNETKKQISEPTAVSMLGFVEEKGLIDRTFEAKLPKSLCSLSSKEYHDNRLGVKQSSPKVKTTYKRTRGSENQQVSAIPESSKEVKVLMSDMREWDRRHTRSMEPPGHPPSLSYCILQRKFPN